MADQIFKGRLYAAALGIGPIEEHTARVALTAAQLRALNTSPANLVPAPKAGQVLIFEELLFDFKYPASGGVQYTGGGVVEPVYHGTTASLSVGAIPAAILTAAASSLTHLAQQASATGITAVDGGGIDLYAATGNFAAGNGTAIVIVNYAIWQRG